MTDTQDDIWFYNSFKAYTQEIIFNQEIEQNKKQLDQAKQDHEKIQDNQIAIEDIIKEMTEKLNYIKQKKFENEQWQNNKTSEIRKKVTQMRILLGTDPKVYIIFLFNVLIFSEHEYICFCYCFSD